MKNKRWILPIIVLSQFCCTSLWFASNAIMNELSTYFYLDNSALGHLTSAVQLGFIAGTLVFALFAIADRFSPSRVFFFSALAAAVFNLGTILEANTFSSLLCFRFLTGFFLAGIHPVGMKIAADYYQKGLGKSLGYLVGALVIGTAFPHLLKASSQQLPWKFVLLFTSSIALLGGILMVVLIPNGPYRKINMKPNLSTCLIVFKNSKLRTAAFGYFGHMWELYAFWAFVPIFLATYSKLHPNMVMNVPFLSFIVIGIGGFSCILGGYLSAYFGVKKTASTALMLSCLCCLVSPFAFYTDSNILFIGFLIFWGMVVVADSPLFSTLVAQNTSAASKGTALTIVNCIGFAITIFSIQLINGLRNTIDSNFIFMLLAIGPLFGLIALYTKNIAKVK